MTPIGGNFLFLTKDRVRYKSGDSTAGSVSGTA
jgi:hypothetical protein